MRTAVAERYPARQREEVGQVMRLVACAVVLATRARQRNRSAQPTFRAGVDLVTFGVTAVDRKGNLVTDLTQDDFQILEDGKPQALKYFTRGLGEGEGRRPISV